MIVRKYYTYRIIRFLFLRNSLKYCLLDPHSWLRSVRGRLNIDNISLYECVRTSYTVHNTIKPTYLLISSNTIVIVVHDTQIRERKLFRDCTRLIATHFWSIKPHKQSKYSYKGKKKQEKNSLKMIFKTMSTYMLNLNAVWGDEEGCTVRRAMNPALGISRIGSTFKPSLILFSSQQFNNILLENYEHIFIRPTWKYV